MIWYVLHNSPEIDTYRSQFKSKFPNKDMKEEFPDWFGSQTCQHQVDNDPGVSVISELFALACGPTPTPISVNSCVVNSVRFVVHSRDERHTTQNSSICSPGGKDGEIYYGHFQEILEFSYLSFKVVLFRVKWFDTSKEGCKVKHLVLRNNMEQVLTKDGQSTKVDAPPYIIDLDEDDDIINDEDTLPHDLNDSDDEDLVNVDDDNNDGVDMSADVARGHDSDGGGDDRKGTHKPNLGGRKAGRLHTRQETRNLGLKKITDDKGPVLTREMPLYYPSWKKVPTERKATILTKIGMESSATREYPSLIHTFFVTHTVNGEEMLRLQALGSNTPSGVPYTEEEINALARKGKQRGHLPGVGRVLPGRATDVLIPPPPPPPQCTHNSGDVKKLKKKNKYLTKQVNLMMKLFRIELNQYESTPEFGNASGSDGRWPAMRTAARMRRTIRMAIVRDVIHGEDVDLSLRKAVNVVV
uniref:EF-hand domain pair n=1 Tax=Tanacetum cinerariifolium TaxID=118510 RepID=A0A6L2M3X1_TANCI|nr:EF-hand domain pair [Tanacetum cinerariifolium]